jgi:hypothetical protein
MTVANNAPAVPGATGQYPEPKPVANITGISGFTPIMVAKLANFFKTTLISM